MSVCEKTFVVGKYWTEDGYEAMVDAVAENGYLVGRINIQTDATKTPIWQAYLWEPSGKSQYGITGRNLVADKPAPALVRTYWVNIYTSGPGLLRENWEQCLVEASRSEEPVLARTKVYIDTRVGEGLK